MQYKNIKKNKINGSRYALEGEDFEILAFKLHHSHSNFINVNWFKPTCFSLTLVLDGHGQFGNDENVLDLSPGVIFFSSPNTNRRLDWHTRNEIYHISFSERFLSHYAGVALFKTFPFLLLEKYGLMNAGLLLGEQLCSIFKLIDQEHEYDSGIQKKIIANLVTRLLLQIKRNFWESYDRDSKKDEENDIVKQFIQSLENHYRQLLEGETFEQLRLTDLAKMQGIHENYLSNVIKKKTDKLVSYWIAEKTLIVAQMLLKNSSIPIKEVSCRLGFRNITYFYIFFKKHTGLTPKNFRILS